MNLIPCHNPCKHQRDGYCTLCGVSEPATSRECGCGYFIPLPSSAKHGGERGAQRGCGDESDPLGRLR